MWVCAGVQVCMCVGVHVCRRESCISVDFMDSSFSIDAHVFFIHFHGFSKIFMFFHGFSWFSIFFMVFHAFSWILMVFVGSP